MNNPLLDTAGLPRFASIRAAHIEPAIDQRLAEHRAGVDALLKNTGGRNWDNFIQPLEDLDERLDRAWGPANHLHSVADHEALRAAYNACLPKIADHATALGQNEALFQAYQEIADSPAFASLSVAQQKIINNALRDFRLSGIDLGPKDKARYKVIQQALSKLQTRFEENLLDATRAWQKPVSSKAELAGLPESALALAAETAARAGQNGWLLTLDLPCYLPVIQYADNADLRREMCTAYMTRASDQGPHAGQWDNSASMREILQYRTEKARLLGFESYAHYSLATKMAETPAEVMRFLNDLAARSRAQAEREFAELSEFAAHTAGLKKLEAWDISYYSEKLRQEKFAISQETLKSYFPVQQVIEGLFAITERLYGVRIKPRAGVETWHEQVLFFDLLGPDGGPRAGFYLDLYARPGKRGGAWMDECVVRKKSAGGIQHPVAYLTCNFTPPVGGKPALLTHDEVATLFHEFGHGLHHMLTRMDYSGVSGINGVPWDAVELPSQFMENWCWETEALALFARHSDNGQPLPADLNEKMRRARGFQAGLQMLRQLEFAIFDFRLHLEFARNENLDIQALLDEVRREVGVLQPPAFNRFQHSFSHIFAGGYAAGYYSYKWAEVLSADAFSRFEEAGIFDPASGQAFLQTILEQGGSREPMDLFIEFRGRRPSIDPLLRHSGIAA